MARAWFKHLTIYLADKDIVHGTSKILVYKITFGNRARDFFIFFLAFHFLSVLRGHSVFRSPPQRPMTSDLEGFSIQDVIHYNFFPNLIIQKEPVFPY